MTLDLAALSLQKKGFSWAKARLPLNQHLSEQPGEESVLCNRATGRCNKDGSPK